MTKRLKLTTIGFSALLLSTLLSGKEITSPQTLTGDLDKKILDYNKKVIDFNPNFKLKNQTIIKKEKLGSDKNWFAYTIDLEIIDNGTKKEIKTPYFIFSNGEYLTTTMVNINTNERYGDDAIRAMRQKEQLAEQKVRTDFESKFLLDTLVYTKERFIAGNIDAKTKVAIFSDPLCVYCVKTAPMLIEEISKRDDIGLYYFNFPLDSIHPTSRTVIKAIEASKKLGIKNGEFKIYKANLENYYDVYQTKDNQIALDAVNKILETKLVLADLETQEIQARIDADNKIALEANVQGTPSILFNGSYVEAREKLFEALGLKKK
ncbi:MAG: thioredoxin domain-containing protein [Arcobacter sp.]|nr:thioredoxin domain-containing protein [Arcobacter sp.]